MSKKILITGSSGFIGRYLIDSLIHNEHICIGAYLHHRPLARPNCFLTCTDLRTNMFAQGTLDDVKTVIHLAWSEAAVHKGESAKNQNLMMTERLINQLEKTGVTRLIYLSALGANKQASTPHLCEKYQNEQLILNSKIPEKIIIRSSIVYSGRLDDDRLLQYVLKQLQKPWFYVVPKPDRKIAPIHVKDLVQFVSQLIENDMSIGSNIVEIAGQENFSMQQLYKSIANRYTSGKKLALSGPVFEKLAAFKSKEQSQSEVRTTELLLQSNEPTQEFMTNNPLTEYLPLQKQGFMMSLAEKK